MNAHNEQQGFTAGDMADQGARQFEAGCAAAKAEQRAAANEALSWKNIQDFINWNRDRANPFVRPGYESVVLDHLLRYAAPAAAVPAGVQIGEWQGNDLVNSSPIRYAPGIERGGIPDGTPIYAGTPAAPGIDLQWLVEGLDEIGSLSRNLRQGGCDAGDLEGLENGLMHAVDMAHQLRDRLLALIDASPKGGAQPVAGSAVRALPARWFNEKTGLSAIGCANELTNALAKDDAVASPKAGSEGDDAALLDWMDASGFTAYRQIDPIDGLSRHCVVVAEAVAPRHGNVHDTIRGAIRAAMQAQADDAETAFFKRNFYEEADEGKVPWPAGVGLNELLGHTQRRRSWRQSIG